MVSLVQVELLLQLRLLLSKVEALHSQEVASSQSQLLITTLLPLHLTFLVQGLRQLQPVADLLELAQVLEVEM